MWPFSRKPKKDALGHYKTVRIQGWTFTIRKINPLLDFQPDKMPVIFADKKPRKSLKVEATERRHQNDMMEVVRVGTIGLGDVTVEDIFRVPSVGIELYAAIMAHTLNLYDGIRGVFFYHKTRRALLTLLQGDTELDLVNLFSGEVEK